MRIIVGVSGGVAAYKACDLVSRLVQRNHEVRVLMTPNAADFVGPLSFRALTGQTVGIMTDDEPDGPLSHIRLAHWAQALVVAPATASLLARWAAGQASDLLSLVYLAFGGPVLVAPAMEPDMWAHPRTQANVETLKGDGVKVIGPDPGRLASGRVGLGRMVGPEELVDAVEHANVPPDLSGVTLVVTAGATFEYFDPVRLMTNPSTGFMGVTIANLACWRGARVILVEGPSVKAAKVHPDVERRPVESAQDMLSAVQDVMSGADAFIGAAAVSDFRPAHRLTHKAKKDSLDLQWQVEENPDIIRWVKAHYGNTKWVVGFAAETENPVENAQKKCQDKGLDAIVANLVGTDQGFGYHSHQAWLLWDDQVEPLFDGAEGSDGSEGKVHTADRLLNWLADRIQEASGWSH